MTSSLFSRVTTLHLRLHDAISLTYSSNKTPGRLPKPTLNTRAIVQSTKHMRLCNNARQ